MTTADLTFTSSYFLSLFLFVFRLRSSLTSTNPKRSHCAGFVNCAASPRGAEFPGNRFSVNMIDHVLGRPSVKFRKIQVLAVVSFWSFYLSRCAITLPISALKECECTKIIQGRSPWPTYPTPPFLSPLQETYDLANGRHHASLPLRRT